jgi:hypothetical protein
MKNTAQNYITLNKFFVSFLFLILFGCGFSPSKENLSIRKDPAFPRWLKAGDYATSQTSGTFFLGADKDGNKNFLLADDIGKIHHFKIKDDTVFSFSPIYFSENVKAFLDTFPKWDFEEIIYDKYTNSTYLSIEGNNPDPKKYVGIYKIIFQNNNVYSDSIVGIEKLHIKPESLFLKYVANNIGYEGLAIDKNYFYLGLEGFSESGIFADSTFLFMVDKKNLQIIKQINSKPFDIHTICGLYSDKDNSLWGVDRNSKKIFHITFDNSLEIKSFGITEIPTNIPAYPQFDYVAALESITIDNEKNIYLVDDPWKTFYVPAQAVLAKLDSTTVKNFKKFVPTIFKFKLVTNTTEN